MNKLQLCMTVIITFIAVHVANVELLAQDQQQNQLLVNNNRTGNILQWDTDQVSLADLLSRLEEKFSVTFLYDHKTVANKFVSQSKAGLSANPGPDLSRILLELGLAYDEIYEGIFLLMPRQVHLDMASLMQAVSGTVTDASTGETLPGVNILIKGTSIGSSTGPEGNYELNVPSLQDTLIVSYIGYETQEIPINGRTEIEIALHSQAIAGEELVVVGYGTQKKINLTGSVTNISSENLENKPFTKVSNALSGQMPGVYVVQNQGMPGTGSFVRIRGIGTMNNSAPMIIVDGIETGSMDDINPSDIERIDVLKDAAAAAIYGTRATNGVVLITTKRGETGEARINYDMTIGKQVLGAFPEYTSSYVFAREYNKANELAGIAPLYSEEELQKYRDGSDPINYPNTDWFDHVLNGSGLQHNHTLSASGGTEQARYMVSLGYLDQEGLIKGNYYDRYSLRVNLDSKISERLDFSLSSSLTREDYSQPNSRFDQGVSKIMVEAHRTPPTVPVKAANGLYASFIGNNSAAWVEGIGGTRTRRVLPARLSSSLEYELMEGLKVKGLMGVVHELDKSKRHAFSYEFDGFNQSLNSISKDSRTTDKITLSSFLNYDKSFGDHSVKGLIGLSRETYKTDFVGSYREDFPSNLITSLSAGGLDGEKGYGTGLERTLGSYFGRVNYNFKEKYLLEASLRRDGSSKFGEGYRWGWFPSVSIGWRIIEEPFMKNINFLTNLKVFGSIGRLGNHNIGDFLYSPLISFGSNYVFDGNLIQGAYVGRAENRSISWEKSNVSNVGLDIGIKNKLNLSVEYYDRYTYDILTTVPVPSPFGLSAPTQNIGAMRNKGVEFLLNYTNTIGTDFNYDISFNLSMNRNIVEKWPTPTRGTRIRIEGESWNSYYGYEWIGYFQNEDELANEPKTSSADIELGDLKYKDQNGDGVINADDRVVIGNAFPGTVFGLNLNANYRNFNLSMHFQGLTNRVNDVARDHIRPFLNGGKIYKQQLDYWTPENRDAKYPRLRVNSSTNNSEFSSYYVRDASFIRLKNVRVGYTLPKSRILNRVNIFLSANNLLQFTDFWDGVWDPENTSGVASYPHVRTITLGLNIQY